MSVSKRHMKGAIMGVHVGVRDLRNNLSRWLEAVQAGEELVVTERGRPVARILPADRPSIYERLIAEGVIRPATKPKQRARTPALEMPQGVSLSDWIIENR